MSKKLFGLIAGLTLALAVMVAPVVDAEELSLDSMSTEQLIALIQQLLTGSTSTSTSTTTSTTTTTTGSSNWVSLGIPADFQFDANLKLGMSGNDAKYLQIVLNSDAATAVATTGTGSAGSESTYFGAMTQAAVVKFQNKYASTVLTPLGLTTGTGFVGTTTRAQLNALLAAGTTTTPTTSLPAGCTSTTGFSTVTGLSCSTVSTLPTGCTSTTGFSPVTGQSCASGTTTPVVTPVTGSGMTVALASDSPASTTIVTGQAIAPLAKFVLTNSDSVTATITTVELQRLGVSADTTLSNVYLYNGDTRLTDAATISQGKVTFNSTSGVITIPAGQSVIVTVVSDIALTTSGQTVGVSLTGLTSNVTVKSTLPLNGGTQTIASATLATATVGTVSTATGTVNAGTANYTVFSAPLTIGTRTVSLKAVTLKQIGSISTDSLENIQLYVNGIAVGSSIALASDGTARFVLTTPYEIQSGSSTLEVRADVVKGSSRNFSFSLQNASDLVIVDSVYNVNTTVSGTPKTTGIITINEGSVSVTLDSTFNTTSITSGTSNATLAKYNFKAYGENVKVSYLDITPSTSMDNVVIYANGSPITSYQNYTGTTLHFNLGSSLVIPANSTTSVEVRADTKVNGVNITASPISVSLTPYANNAQGVSSSQLVTVPSISVSGPSLTIGTGTLALVKASGVADGKITPNTDNQKIGSYVIQAGATESVKINNLTLTLGGTLSTASLSNLYIKYNGISTTPITPQLSNNFSVNLELAAGQSMTVEAYANVGGIVAVPNTNTTQVLTASTPATAVAQVSLVTLVTDETTGTGNIVVTIKGIPVTVAIPASTITAAATSIANSINSNINVNGYVSASASAGVVTLTSRTLGTAGTFTLATSKTTTEMTVTDSTTAASNGSATVTLSGAYEAGDVMTVVINGTTVAYTAASTNTTTEATALAAAINTAAISGVTASGSGAVVTLSGTITSLTAVATNGSTSSSSSTVITTANVNATGVASNVTVLANASSSAVTGQTMTTAVATLATPTLATSSPAAQFVLGGSTGAVAQYNFIATNGDVTLDKVSFKVTDGATPAVLNETISSITVNGKTAYVVNSVATISGLGFTVPSGYAGLSLPITVTYNNVGKDTFAAVTSNSVSTLTLTSFEYLAGNTRTASGTVTVEANDMNVVNAIPSVALTSDNRTGLVTGNVKLADITISADANGGDIKVLTLPIKSVVTGTGVTLPTATNKITLRDASGNLITGTASTVFTSDEATVTITAGYGIAAGTSKTFSVYADVTGVATNNAITTSLGSKASFTFVDVNSDTTITSGTPIYTYSTNSSTIKNY